MHPPVDRLSPIPAGASPRRFSRRTFLQTSAAAAACGPLIAPSHLFGADAPSNRIHVACIGMGWMGPQNCGDFLNQSDCRVVAVCDVDAHHLQRAKQQVDGRYGNNDCAAYREFERIMERPDIDAVMIAVPDHWHAIPAIAAAKAGKDIYGEKPLGHTLREGRAICDAVERYGRVWQTGSWQRSQQNFRQAAQAVRNGRIGTVRRIEVGLLSGTYGRVDETVRQPPDHLDYDRWLGPAPWAPYAVARVHVNWRWMMDYAGGQLMDWVGHHVDIAHWGMGWDETGPYEVSASGDFLTQGLWDVPVRYRVTAKYAGDVEMIVAGGHADIQGGTRWIGDDGWVHCDRGRLEASRPDVFEEQPGRDEVQLYSSPGHIREFLDCVKTRGTPLAPVEAAHRCASVGQLGLIAMQLGRTLHWNPETETIADDPVANRMLGKTYRAPWIL